MKNFTFGFLALVRVVISLPAVPVGFVMGCLTMGYGAGFEFAEGRIYGKEKGARK